MARVKDSEEPRFISKDDLMSQAKEYSFLKKQIEYLEKQQRALRDSLFEKIEDKGEADSNGNIVLELPEDVEGVVALTKQRRVTRKIKEDVAMEIIEAKGLKDKLIKTIEVIDEDALMAALYSDELTEEEIDEMYPQSVVWALVMKKN